MLENAMPGEALLSNMVPAENLKAASQNSLPNKTLQEMAGKLEKSEAGRKKLRQAISMLKEKVEANEKVLQVNEILRQECEKEKLRADAERNRMEEEKKLREQVEKDGLSTKEQLVRVLQRLDAVERNCKSDHNEIERMRKEMKQAFSGLGGAVKAIEAAHSSFQDLEKNLLGKVGNAVSASTKSTSLSEIAISDAKRAQGTAVAAEKQSQSLVSRVTVLQKQGASLDQRVALLQQEIRERQLADDEPKSNWNRGSNATTSLTADKHLGRGMVLTKNQQQAGTPLNCSRTVNKDCLPESGDVGLGLAHAEVTKTAENIVKPAAKDSVGTCGSLSPEKRHRAEAAGVPGTETLPESHAKDASSRGVSSAHVNGKAADISVRRIGILDSSRPASSGGNTVRDALDAARHKRNLSQTTSTSKGIPQPENSSSFARITLGPLPSNAHATKDCPVEGNKFLGRVQVDSGNGSTPALPENERNDYTPASVSIPHRIEGTHGSNTEDCPGWRPGIESKRSRAPDENGAETKLIIANPVLIGKGKKIEVPKCATKIVKNGHNREKLPVTLLKEITKLFQKEKKSHAKVQRKLTSLQIMLQNSEDNEVSKGGFVGSTLEKSRKRNRRETLRDSSKKKLCGAVVVRGSEQKSKNDVTGDCSTVPFQPPANKIRYSGLRGCGNDVPEAGLGRVQNCNGMDGAQFPDAVIGMPITPPSPVFDSLRAAAPVVMAPSEGMDMDAENVSGGGLHGGWDSDTEVSEDEFGEDWWTAKPELLSPSLPFVPPPAAFTEEPDSNAPLLWPGNLEDISLFLDVLPPIDQKACDEDRTLAPLPNITDSKFGVEYSCHIQSVVTAGNGEPNEELKPGLATETLSDLHSSRERSTSKKFVEVFESGSKPSERSGDFIEGENKESWIGGPLIHSSSMSSRPQPEPSLLLPEDGIVGPLGKSGALEQLMVDSGALTDDVIRGSQDVVKDEKLDLVLVENVSPYSLELVLGGSTYASEVHPTGSTMRHGPVIFTGDISDKIIMAFGSFRKVLLGSLIHATYGAYGSSQAAATKLASLIASSPLPKLDLTCIFTASVVDSHALWDSEKTASCQNSECKSLQLLIDIVKQVLDTEVFQNVVSPFLLFADQLQTFLIQGRIDRLHQATPDGAPSEDHAMHFHFTTPSLKLKRLKALISGGKLLAVLCETIGKLDFLRNSIYSVLRFCDMDSQCLLATVSSFACVGCKSLFSVDKDDVVGQAVQVVISELIHDVEMGRQTEASSTKKEEMVECEMDMQHGSFKGTEQSTDCIELLPNLNILREVIGEEDGLSFESLVPRLLEVFHGVITASLGSHLEDNRHLFQRCLQTITCNQMKPKCLIAANYPDGNEQSLKTSHTADVTCSGITESATQCGGKEDDCRSPLEDYCWRYVRVNRSTQPMSHSESDANIVEEWEQKFYDITNAVELVASHLGWEWTYNDFIVEHLWKLVSPGAPAMTVACVVHMFGLLGRLGREVDSTELPGVDELRKSLLVVLSSDQTTCALTGGSLPKFPFRAQVAAAQALLVLSSFNRKDEIVPCKDPEKVFCNSSELHAKSVKSLWNWVKVLQTEIQQVLPSSVRCALLSIGNSNFVPIF